MMDLGVTSLPWLYGCYVVDVRHSPAVLPNRKSRNR
ncbi:unnamed protein product [Acanthoscelides obtectus]|uniref:Uncharacterized protein n=1 Tax=Acanthoscelides obtectus TaxID=200917 RepID=A0A9P0PU81_ACAOB|nr:unnamed protein product [Acanthoscelides obtectus]CAK1653364.1 hypothetical protein AOBTE_LOCUS18201 [Acanthoscelides obtectus]